VHTAALPPSSWQLNVVPVLLELNEKLALIAFVGFAGAPVIVTTGAVVSIVHVVEALPELPDVSVAVTTKVCEPAARPL
jgi:hypothetical protein